MRLFPKSDHMFKQINKWLKQQSAGTWSPVGISKGTRIQSKLGPGVLTRKAVTVLWVPSGWWADWDRAAETANLEEGQLFVFAEEPLPSVRLSECFYPKHVSIRLYFVLPLVFKGLSSLKKAISKSSRENGIMKNNHLAFCRRKMDQRLREYMNCPPRASVMVHLGSWVRHRPSLDPSSSPKGEEHLPQHFLGLLSSLSLSVYVRLGFKKATCFAFSDSLLTQTKYTGLDISKILE